MRGNSRATRVQERRRSQPIERKKAQLAPLCLSWLVATPTTRAGSRRSCPLFTKEGGKSNGAKESDDGWDGENHRVVRRPATREEVPQPTRKEATDEQPQTQNRHIDERLPEITRALAEPLSKVDRIVVISNAGNGVGASRITQDVVNMVAQIPPVLESLTGINVRDLVTRLPGIQQSDAGQQSGDTGSGASEKSTD